MKLISNAEELIVSQQYKDAEHKVEPLKLRFSGTSLVIHHGKHKLKKTHYCSFTLESKIRQGRIQGSLPGRYQALQNEVIRLRPNKRPTIRFSTWNVKGLHHSRKLENLIQKKTRMETNLQGISNL